MLESIDGSRNYQQLTNQTKDVAYGKEDLGSLKVEDHDLTGGRIDIFSCPWPPFS